MADNKNNKQTSRKNKSAMTPAIIISIIVLIASIYLFNLIAENSQSNAIMYIGIPIVVSMIVATIYLINRIEKMNTVRYQEMAHNYAVKEKFQITNKKDVFVRSVTTSRKISDD